MPTLLEAIPYLAANALWQLDGAGNTRRYRRALRDPRGTQEAVLMRLLKANAECEYGRRHRFEQIRSVREFQETVPEVTYADLEPAIDAIRRGRQGVLTAEPVLMFEKTGGSGGTAKYIPFTVSLRREFSAAVAPWMADLYRHFPDLWRGGAYWSVSPAAARREVTEGGIPVGFEEDSDYFGPLARWTLGRLLLTPRELPRVPRIDTWQYLTLRFLLATDQLTLISVWNPSFLTLLLEAIPSHQEQLLVDIARGSLLPPTPLPPELRTALAAQVRPLPLRTQALYRILREQGKLTSSAVWPHLSVVSCWADAEAARGIPELRRQLPGVEIQPKGLLATEGVVSLPLVGQRGAALAVTSHFLEFRDEAAPEAPPRLVDELEVGGSYELLITTGGGFYRYALGDRIRVAGFVERTPLVEFIGRVGIVSDLRGEKLHVDRAREVVASTLAVFQITPTFAMLAPEWPQGPGKGRPAYFLFLHADNLDAARLQELASNVEAGLAECPHYAYCRRLGQLGPLTAVRLQRGAAQWYLDRCVSLGQRYGDVKPVALHRAPGWRDWFHPIFMEEAVAR